MEEMVEIYRKYMPQVYNFLFSLCHDAHLSEELTQETFFQALKSIDSLVTVRYMYGYVRLQNIYGIKS